jgi:hypothetical protein
MVRMTRRAGRRYLKVLTRSINFTDIESKSASSANECRAPQLILPFDFSFSGAALFAFFAKGAQRKRHRDSESGKLLAKRNPRTLSQTPRPSESEGCGTR